MWWEKYQVDVPDLRNINFAKLGAALKQPCAGCGHEHHGPPPRRRAPAWRPAIVVHAVPASTPRPRAREQCSSPHGRNGDGERDDGGDPPGRAHADAGRRPS